MFKDLAGFMEQLAVYINNMLLDYFRVVAVVAVIFLIVFLISCLMSRKTKMKIRRL